jgi:hypothetical protein
MEEASYKFLHLSGIKNIVLFSSTADFIFYFKRFEITYEVRKFSIRTRPKVLP